MQNNERREHILEKIFQECVFYSFLIAMSKTPHTQYLCMFARHGNLFYHSKFIVTTSSKWYN